MFCYLFVKQNNYSQLSVIHICMVINYKPMTQKKKRKNYQGQLIH